MRTPGRSRPSTVDTRWRTPAIGRSSRNVLTRTDPGTHTRPRSFRSRSTIITCSARSLPLAAIGSVESAGRVPLMGIVHTRSPRVRRKSSGVARDDRPAVAVHRSRELGAQRSQRPLDAGRVTPKRRTQVLHEVHLVDVAPPDGALRLGDRGRVLRRRPRPLPRPDRIACKDGVRPQFCTRPRSDPAGRDRQRAGLGRPTAREAVSKVEVGGESAIGGEEALDAIEGIRRRGVEHERAAVTATVGEGGADALS